MLTEEGSTHQSPAAPIWAIWRTTAEKSFDGLSLSPVKNAILSSLSLGAALCLRIVVFAQNDDDNGYMGALCATVGGNAPCIITR